MKPIPLPTVECPVCHQQVPLGIVGQVVGWHRRALRAGLNVHPPVPLGVGRG